MLDYHAYIIGTDGCFIDAVPLICQCDAEAIEWTKALVDGHVIELWQLDRKVAVFLSELE